MKTILFSFFMMILNWAPCALANHPQLQDPGQEIRFEQNLGAETPSDLIFITENGYKITFGQFQSERPRILVMAYYQCPNLCTLVLNGLVETLRKLPDQLGRDYEVTTISIDPSEKSTLALMKQRSYLARYGDPSLTPYWHFLTSDEDSIRQLANRVGFHYFRDPRSGQYSHPSGIIVLTPKGKISQYFFGIQFDPETLHKALNEARREHQGSWIQEVLLYCFHYDPQSQSTGKLVMNVLRVAGAVSAAALAGMLLLLSRPRRKHSL